MSVAQEIPALLARLGVDAAALDAGPLPVRSPIDGAILGHLPETGAAEVTAAITRAEAAFQVWRLVPAPRRGELIRLFGEELRHTQGRSWPPGHARSRQDRPGGPGRGPGDDRHLRFRRRPVAQLYGLTIATERAGHAMRETWHPLGVVGVISALQLPGRGLVLECCSGPGLR